RGAAWIPACAGMTTTLPTQYVDALEYITRSSYMWQGIIACSRLSSCPVVVRHVVQRDTIQRGNHYPCPPEPYRAESCYAYITRIHAGPDPTARSAPGSAGATAPGPPH